MIPRTAKLGKTSRFKLPISTKHKSSSLSSTSAPTLEDFIEKRDYVGASTILNFESRERSQVDTLLWKGYCAFHNYDLAEAQEIYIELLSSDKNEVPKETSLYLACVYYHMQMYDEAKEAAEDGPDCPLKHRLMFHLAHRLQLGEEGDGNIVELRQKLRDSIEDQLSKAAMLYMQGNYQESTNTYKRLLIEHMDCVSLNLYVAMCYFKMDYYDVSLEILSVYEQMHSDSIYAKNLRACNNFRLCNGNAALDELKGIDLDSLLSKNELLQHNMVVFTDGQNKALQYLSPLVDVIPEARLNLAIYYLRNGESQEAESLLSDLEPVTPQEFILKGVVKATAGQAQDDPRMVKEAQSYFQTVGTSPTETDTIPGRQCMASNLFLKDQFDEANVYLSSIKSYLSDDDDFNWNFGMSLASVGDYIAAEEILLQIRNELYKSDLHYNTWLARCYIMNGKSDMVWKLHSHVQSSSKTDEKFFLEVVANDSFGKDYFGVAAKAYHTLLQLGEDDSEYFNGLESACIGIFRSVVVENTKGNNSIFERTKQELIEGTNILQKYSKNQRLTDTLKTIKQWMKKSSVYIG